MVGAELKVAGVFGASFEYGVWPGHETGDEYEFDVDTWSAGLRVYPFRGTFFVGAVFGEYDVKARERSGAFAESSLLRVKSTYLGPQIGWKWDFHSGLFLGLNLGYGFSLDYSSALAQLPGSDDDLEDLKDEADKYLEPGVPIFTAFEIGWLF
jgi:hypothetical protein